MSFEFLSRRQLFGCTGALILTAIAPELAHSASEPPINDVLSGVGDAADRQRLRQEARKGQWDGQYWNKDGKRYTSGQYRDHLLGNTKPQASRLPKLRPAAITVNLTVPVHLCLTPAWYPIRRAPRFATTRTKLFRGNRQIPDGEPEASAEAADSAAALECADKPIFVSFLTS